jgi:hypothetical protein
VASKRGGCDIFAGVGSNGFNLLGCLHLGSLGHFAAASNEECMVDKPVRIKVAIVTLLKVSVTQSSIQP